ncbi:MAG: peptidase C39 family protein [Candidatus Woesearchaeota archaeon]
MRLDVPFFKQTSSQNCGPTALRMVLAYLGKDEGIDVLEARTGIKEGKGISTIQIAIAAASSGYRANFYSRHVLFNEDNLKHEYYQQFSDMDLEQSKKLVEDAKAVGVNIHEKPLSLEDILGFVSNDSVPIILLDWNIVKSRIENGYQGHFVPIVGFDKKNVYVHNQGRQEHKKFMPIPRNLFDEARKAEGTDEDIVIVHRK